MTTAPKFSDGTSLILPGIEMSVPSDGTTSNESISYAAASPARTSLRLGSELGSQVRAVVCGPSSRESLASFDLSGSWSRTSPQFSLLFATPMAASSSKPHSEPFSETFPRSGTMRGGIVFELPMLARRIAENDSSASRGSATSPCAEHWPTATMSDAKSGVRYGKGDMKLSGAVREWPTPLKADASRGSSTFPRGNPTLLGAVNGREWPTPTASMGGPKRPEFLEANRGHNHTTVNLASAVNVWATPCASDNGTRRTPYAQGGTPLSAQVRNEWPTPIAHNAKGARGAGSMESPRSPSDLVSEVQRDAEASQPAHTPSVWPTPTVYGNHNRKGASKHSGDGLSTAVKEMFPTPIARDWKSKSPAKVATNSRPLSEVIGESTIGPLNPTWVEVLMGFPAGYTDTASQPDPDHSTSGNRRAPRTRSTRASSESKPSGTPSSRRSRGRSDASSPTSRARGKKAR